MRTFARGVQSEIIKPQKKKPIYKQLKIKVMKTLEILSENKNGLFTDKKSENDLSTEVAKLFDSGEKKVKVKANGKELVLIGYIKRGATSKDSAFRYVGEKKKYICQELRIYFGLPTYSKPHNEKFEPCKNLDKATKSQIQEEIKRLQKYLAGIEEEEKARLKKEKLNTLLQNVSTDKLLELLERECK